MICFSYILFYSIFVLYCAFHFIMIFYYLLLCNFIKYFVSSFLHQFFRKKIISNAWILLFFEFLIVYFISGNFFWRKKKDDNGMRNCIFSSTPFSKKTENSILSLGKQPACLREKTDVISIERTFNRRILWQLFSCVNTKKFTEFTYVERSKLYVYILELSYCT